MITKEGITRYLKHRLDVTVIEECASTNTLAKEAVNIKKREELLVSRRQSGGRGRMGRSFFSPEGGLYMSFLLYPKLPAERAISVTTAAAVAVCRAIEKISERACGIKWVNDVYIDSKKVCGILTEAKISGCKLDYCILGIGVNLTPPKDGFPDDIKDRAGAVFDILPSDADNRLCAAIADEFFDIYEQGLHPSLYLDEYRDRSVVVGREIDVIRLSDNTAKQAVAVCIDDDCSLTVRYGDGTTETLSSGDVTLRGAF